MFYAFNVYIYNTYQHEIMHIIATFIPRLYTISFSLYMYFIQCYIDRFIYGLINS